MQSDLFKDEIMRKLRFMEGIHCSRIFRHWSLYHEDHLIGIIADDKLYLRTNRLTRQGYIQRKMKPYHFIDRVLRRFYEVPREIIDDAEQLVEWTRDAAAVKSMISRVPFDR